MISLMWASIALQVIGIAILAWGDKAIGWAVWAVGSVSFYLLFVPHIIEGLIT